MIITDTGFWLALANPKDKYHLLATNYLDKIDEPLITTCPVVTETCYLLLCRIGNHAQCTFMQNYAKGVFEVFQINSHHAAYIETLMQKYANLPMDLADGSLIVLAEHLGHGKILSTDQRDFNTYRWKQRQPFENLLFL
jgi:predicted nucleic acid-binding protein